MTDEATIPRIGEPLDALNDGFHDGYDRAREHAEDEAPVLVLLGDAMVRVHRGVRTEFSVTPRTYHVLKSAAHAPILLFVTLHGHGDATREARVLTALRTQLDAARTRIDTDLDDDLARDDYRGTLEKTADALARIESTKIDARARRELAEAFARDIGPLLLRLTDHATRVQLAALHECVGRALEGFSPRDLASLQVVVAGDHQARERNLAMQYFRKRLGEAAGEDLRVTFGENVASVDEALALIGTRRLDRAIARAFFGDPRRLQRDVLGDAARARIDAMEF